MAMDAAMPRDPKRMFRSTREAETYALNYARGLRRGSHQNMAFDAKLNPAHVEQMLRFLATKLSKDDLEQVRGIANTDVPDAGPVQPKPATMTTHGGDPAAPGYGGSKDYAGLRDQAERDNASLNRRDNYVELFKNEQDPSTKTTKDGLIGGLFGAVAGGVAGGPLGALAGGVAGSMLDDNKLGSGGGQDEHYSSHNQRIAMDAKAYEAMFPDASRITMDGWAGVQTPSRQTSTAMSSRNAALYDEMFPTARRINR
jgi:hypothetical protein